MDPTERPRFAAEFRTAAAADSPWWTLIGLRQPAHGDAKIEAQFKGTLPGGGLLKTPDRSLMGAIDFLTTGDLTGNVSVQIADLDYPGAPHVETAIAEFDVRAAEGSLTLTPLSDLKATTTLVDSLLSGSGWPPYLAARFSGPATTTVKMAAPLRIMNRQGELTVSADAGITLTTAEGANLVIQGAGQMRLSRDLALMDFAVTRGSITLQGLEVGETVLKRMTCSGNLAGAAGELDGKLHVEGTLANVGYDGVRASELEFALDTTLSRRDNRFIVRPSADGRAILRQIAGPALVGKLEELVVPISAGDTPLLSARFDGSRLAELTHDVNLGPIEANLALLAGGAKPTRVVFKAGMTRIAGTWMRKSAYQVVGDFPDATIALPGQHVVAHDLRVDVVGPSQAGKPAIRVDIASVRSASTPAAFAPLLFTANAEPGEGRVLIKGRLSDSRRAVDIAIDAEHSFATSKGLAKITMRPLVFRAGGLQPRDVIPAAGGLIRSADGSAAIGGRITWGKGKVRSDLELLVEDMTIAMPQVEIVRLNSVVAIQSVVPLATRPDQQLAVGLIDIGVPLRDGLATFRLEPGPRLVIDGARLSLAGGEVALTSIAIDPTDPRVDTALRVSDVDLGRLLELAAIDGLTATGRLSGELPLIVEAGGVAIRNAVLKSSEPGILRYAPKETPSALLGAGESMSLALQALTNFRYTEVQLTLNRDAGGETTALMHVKGSNPDFYGGYPVEFNLNVSGKLDQILDRSLAGYRVPDTIREKLLEFYR